MVNFPQGVKNHKFQIRREAEKVQKRSELKKISKVPRSSSQNSLPAPKENRRSLTRRQHSYKLAASISSKPKDEQELEFALLEPEEDKFGAISAIVEDWRQKIWEEIPIQKKILTFPSYEPYSFTGKSKITGSKNRLGQVFIPELYI